MQCAIRSMKANESDIGKLKRLVPTVNDIGRGY
jgi:hypothetical protein